MAFTDSRTEVFKYIIILFHSVTCRFRILLGLEILTISSQWRLGSIVVQIKYWATTCTVGPVKCIYIPQQKCLLLYRNYVNSWNTAEHIMMAWWKVFSSWIIAIHNGHHFPWKKNEEAVFSIFDFVWKNDKTLTLQHIVELHNLWLYQWFISFILNNNYMLITKTESF